MLPVMEKLEYTFHRCPEVAFIGVHSGKFQEERHSDRVKHAILKYNVHHPVVNDENFSVWKNFENKCWPSFCVVGPK